MAERRPVRPACFSISRNALTSAVQKQLIINNSAGAKTLQAKAQQYFAEGRPLLDGQRSSSFTDSNLSARRIFTPDQFLVDREQRASRIHVVLHREAKCKPLRVCR